MPLDDAEKAQVMSRLERMQSLLAELERTQNDRARQTLRERLHRELNAAKKAVTTFGTHDPV